MMLLLEDFPTFTLWHDPTCACLYATWLGRQTNTLARTQYMLIQWHLSATQSTKLLNDSSQDEDGWDQVTDWIANTCFSNLAASGLQVVAWVLPHHPGALFDTARVLTQLKQPIVDTFTDAQGAYDWLHRWPFQTPTPPKGRQMIAVEFLLLPAPEQPRLTLQLGRPLSPRYEPEFYVKPYHVEDKLLVELYYYLHSGVFYQLQARLIS
ncbi:MAG: hypothetical protein EOO60_02315 [Hymenobacter sp.]|nr:MAG: hypothetical protein EOO60_02315 [Hymenobacter sp.]